MCVKEDRCFTLVELIVTVTVVLVLIAMLSIPLAHARRKSHEAACVGNLSQIGLALMMYGDDWDSYPVQDPLQDNWKTPKLHCPANQIADFDTYSAGYYGGHPRNIRPNDFLVVCGSHNRGALALYGDYHVASVMLDGKQPVMMAVQGQAVTPGYVFTSNAGLDLQAPNGQVANITGVKDSQLISAYYDPTAWDGAGEFVVLMAARTPENNEADTNVDTYRISGDSYVSFTTRLQYTNVSIQKEPNTNAKLMWKALSNMQANSVSLQTCIDHVLLHRFVGATLEGEGSEKFDYNTSAAGLERR